MIILLYTIAAYGLTNLLVYGTGPFDMLVHFRRLCGRILPTLGDMLECMMCTSANVGWIVSALNLIYINRLRFYWCTKNCTNKHGHG